MTNLISKLSVSIKRLVPEEGQDLVEYALLVALIAFAVTAGIGSLASKINSVFSGIGSTLTTAV
jgi:pilus assembly protein Flp/PilA